MNTHLRNIMIVVGMSLAAPCLSQEPPSLAKRLEELMDGPDYQQSHWGVLFVDAKTGDVVYNRNELKLFTPASVTKLFSGASALTTLGADHRFVTPVHQRGELQKDGTLKGDIILVASGDLTMGGRTNKDGKILFADHDHTYANSGLMESELPDTNPLKALENLAEQIQKAGVKKITGEILIDDRLFEVSRGSGSGPDIVTPILINDNVVDLIITPGENEGDPVQVKTRPETAFYDLDVQMTTGVAQANATVLLNQFDSHHITVRGKVPAGAKPIIRILPVDDPARFARTLFIEVLRKQGIDVQAALVLPAMPPLPSQAEINGFPIIAKHTSEPFADVFRVILKVSHNLYASTLPSLMAVKKGSRTATAGLVAQGAALKKLGVDIQTISFAGGAGGAAADSVTPKATVQLIQGMAKHEDWEIYKSAMPILGVDGTLAEVVADNSPAKGHVRGKTGTLIWTDLMNGRGLLKSKALAGVMTTENGQELYYAIFVNDVPLPRGVPTSREGKMLGKIVETVYLYAK